MLLTLVSAVLLAVLTTLFTTFGYVTMESIISVKTEESFRNETGDIRDLLESEVKYQQLFTLSLHLENNDASSYEDRNRAMSLLEDIAEDSVLSGRPGFMGMVEKIVSAFYATGYGAELTKIHEIFGRKLISHKEIARVMMTHYGDKVVGTDAVVSQDDPQYAILRQYISDAPDQTPLRGLKMFWTLLTQFKHDKASDRVRNLVDQSIEMSGGDAKTMGWRLFSKSKAERWQINPTSEGRTIEKIVGELLQMYPDLNTLLEDNPDLNTLLEYK